MSLAVSCPVMGVKGGAQVDSPGVWAHTLYPQEHWAYLTQEPGVGSLLAFAKIWDSDEMSRMKVLQRQRGILLRWLLLVIVIFTVDHGSQEDRAPVYASEFPIFTACRAHCGSRWPQLPLSHPGCWDILNKKGDSKQPCILTLEGK